MRKEELERILKALQHNIEYYKKVYGPNLPKVKEIENRISQLKKMLGGTK